jgi:hypothetical protein
MNRRDFLKSAAATGAALVGKPWLPTLPRFGGLVPPGIPPSILTDEGHVVPAALAKRSMWVMDNFGVTNIVILGSLTEEEIAERTKAFFGL